MNPDALSQTLNKFKLIFANSFIHLLPEAQWLLTTLAVLELVLLGLWWACGDDNGLGYLLQKVLFVGFFLYLVQQWPALCTMVLQSFVKLGLLAGGDTITIRQFFDPGAIATYGVQAAQPILLHLNSYSGLGAMGHLPDIVISGLCALFILFAFFIIAVQVFITLIEFYLVSALTLVLVPFGVFRHTAFLAERAFAGVISFGLKLLVLAAVASAIYPILTTFSMASVPTWNEEFAMVLVALAFLMLAWHAPSVAAGILSGAPSLTAHTAAGTALATGATMYGAAYATRAGLQAAHTVAMGTVTTGSALAYSIGPHGQGVAQLAQKAGKDLALATTRNFREAATRGMVYAGASPGTPTAPRPAPTSGSGSGLAAHRILQRGIPHQTGPQGSLNVPLKHHND